MKVLKVLGLLAVKYSTSAFGQDKNFAMQISFIYFVENTIIINHSEFKIMVQIYLNILNFI